MTAKERVRKQRIARDLQFAIEQIADITGRPLTFEDVEEKMSTQSLRALEAASAATHADARGDARTHQEL